MPENDKHKRFIIRTLREKTRTFYLTKPMRISTLYWGVASLFLLEKYKTIGKLSDRMRKFAVRCQNTDGGFGARPGYPSNPLFTLSALQLFTILNLTDEIIKNNASSGGVPPADSRIVKSPGQFTIQERKDELLDEIFEDQSEEKSDSSDIGDEFNSTESAEKTTSPQERIVNYVLCNAYLEKIVTNEKLIGYSSVLDLRYICCYVASKTLLSQLSLGGPEMFYILAPMKRIICNYISECINIDGGIGPMPGCESHAAYTFCGVASLYLLGEISVLCLNETAMQIGLLQNQTGGISGRVDKIEEICSTYWNISSIVLLGKDGYIDKEAAKKYVESCECADGGYSDRPADIPDLLHTFYCLMSISIINGQNILEVLPILSLCLFD